MPDEIKSDISIDESQEWTCDRCNTPQVDAEIVRVDNENWCKNCFDNNGFYCDDCDRAETTSDAVSVLGGDRNVCQDCYSNDYISCQNCGYTFLADDSYSCDYHEASFCEDCFNEHHGSCNDNEDYRDYSHRVENGNPALAKEIKDARPVGVEVEAVDGDVGELSRLLDRKVGISDDGSVHGEETSVEIQTPPASADKLEHYLDNITDSLSKSGFSVNRSCGLHVHFDGSDFKDKPSKAIKLFNLYYTIEPIIFAMMPRSRRSNTYARGLAGYIDEDSFNQILKKTRTKDKYYLHKKWYKTANLRTIDEKRYDKYDQSRYHGFNLHALLSLGHLEIRYHNGTTNKRKIKDWIQFNLHLINWARNKYNKLALDVIKAIPNEELDKKTMLTYRLLDMPSNLQDYVSSRINKFKNQVSSSDDDYEQDEE